MNSLQSVPFWKMHHLGNHFVFLNEFAFSSASEADAQWNFLKTPGAVRLMCDPARGIGADGVVFLRRPHLLPGDARMQIFNRDGGEAEICGNALLCLGHLYQSVIDSRSSTVSIEAGGSLRELVMQELESGFPRYRLQLGTVSFDLFKTGELDHLLSREPLLFTHHGTSIKKDEENNPVALPEPIYVNVGNPHAVFFFDHPLPFSDMEALGSQLETHPRHPRRINVEFVTVESPSHARVYVWERGCGMTDACGTGAAAVCAAGVREGRLQTPVTIHMPGGSLQVDVDSQGHVALTGTVHETVHGELSLDFLRRLSTAGKQ
ncbi:MAG: diaminopimelate epimerase [Candidatus Ozemobacteraceae bacterium]